jgi:excisionase family DNA binding protein
MHAKQTPLFLTVPEFAAALRVHPASIYRRIQSGEIDARRIGVPPGGRFRISADELDRLLERVDDGSPAGGSFAGADPAERRGTQKPGKSSPPAHAGLTKESDESR